MYKKRVRKRVKKSKGISILQNDDYLIRKIFIYINDENIRQVMEKVCLSWKRNSLMINPPESYRRALKAKNLEDADFLLNNAGKVISDHIKEDAVYAEVCVKFACEFVDGITHLDWILSESYHKRRISEFSSSFPHPINIVTKNGFIESLKVLLKHGYKITYDSDIYTSYNNGDKKMMQYLFENTIIYFKNQQNLLSIAIHKGYVRDLAYFLNDWRFKANYHSIFDALLQAAKYKNRPKCFKLLLSYIFRGKVYSERLDCVFYNVCHYGGTEQARILIDEYGISPSLEQNMPIISACEGGNISMIKFLLEYPEVNVFDRNNRAYYRAKKNSLQDVLDLLDDYKSNGCQLEKKTFKSCDSFDNLTKRFEKACYDNDHHLVKSILDEYIEDISSYDILLYIIKRPSHIQIFNLLINDWRFRFKREMLRKILYEAAAAPYEYFLPILKYSANHTYSTDKLFMFRLLVKACQGGDVRTVNYLLYNYKLDPSIKTNICVIEACINGHLEVVKILLKYPNVDPHDRQNKGYRWAEKKGFTNIIEYLDNRLFTNNSK